MSEACEDLLSRLESSSVGFLLPLRLKEGFNDKAYEQLCDVLKECVEMWASIDVLPKKAVLIFVEMHPSLVGSEDMYSEPTKVKIMDAELNLTELLMECASKPRPESL